LAYGQYIITEKDLKVIQRNDQYYIIMLIEDIIKYGFKIKSKVTDDIEFYNYQLFMDVLCSVIQNLIFH